MKRIGLILAIAGLLILITTNCTRAPSDKQLQVLTETKAAAEAAEGEVEDLKREKVGLERQLAGKKAELDKANAEKTRAVSAE